MGFLDLFRRAPIEEKASIVGPLIVANSAGQAQWTKRDLQAYARDGYQRNPIVYRAIQLVSENAASMPAIAKRSGKEVADHPTLALLARPNPFMSGRQLLESIYAFRKIAGNAFVEGITVGGAIRELHVHRPERVKVVPGPDGYPQFYEFQINGQKRRIPVSNGVSDVLHLRDFNPLDDWYGQSPLEAAGWAIDGHAYGSQEVATTLRNGGRLQGGFFYEGDKDLTSDQIRQAGEMIRDRLEDARKSRLPAVMNKFWKFEPFGAKPNELMVTDLKSDAAREICFALGVPPMLLGIPGDNTYANYAEANRALWRETVIPFATKTLHEIGAWMGALIGEPDLVLEPNLDGLPALADETSLLWTRLNSAEFVTINEKREATGYKAVENGDDILVSSADVPLSDAGEMPEGQGEPDPNAPDDGDGPDPEDEADAADEPPPANRD